MALDALAFTVVLGEAAALQNYLDKHMQDGTDTRVLVETLWSNLDPMPGFSPKASPFSEDNARDFIEGVAAARKQRLGS